MLRTHLESCLAVKFTLNIILQSELCQFVELSPLHNVVLVTRALNINHPPTLGWMSLKSIKRSTAMPLLSGVS